MEKTFSKIATFAISGIIMFATVASFAFTGTKISAHALAYLDGDYRLTRTDPYYSANTESEYLPTSQFRYWPDIAEPYYSNHAATWYDTGTYCYPVDSFEQNKINDERFRIDVTETYFGTKHRWRPFEYIETEVDVKLKHLTSPVRVDFNQYRPLPTTLGIIPANEFLYNYDSLKFSDITYISTPVAYGEVTAAPHHYDSSVRIGTGKIVYRTAQTLNGLVDNAYAIDYTTIPPHHWGAWNHVDLVDGQSLTFDFPEGDDRYVEVIIFYEIKEMATTSPWKELGFYRTHQIRGDYFFPIKGRATATGGGGGGGENEFAEQ